MENLHKTRRSARGWNCIFSWRWFWFWQVIFQKQVRQAFVLYLSTQRKGVNCVRLCSRFVSILYYNVTRSCGWLWGLRTLSKSHSYHSLLNNEAEKRKNKKWIHQNVTSGLWSPLLLAGPSWWITPPMINNICYC